MAENHPDSRIARQLAKFIAITRSSGAKFRSLHHIRYEGAVECVERVGRYCAVIKINLVSWLPFLFDLIENLGDLLVAQRPLDLLICLHRGRKHKQSNHDVARKGQGRSQRCGYSPRSPG